MEFISLFSGIGGLDLGLERAGMECVAQVEIDGFCQSILRRHWPDVPKFYDVKEYHPDGDADAVVGGFPCQDVSLAGLQAGLDGERSALFFEAMRVVDECGARVVLLENVPGLLSSHGGADFARILEELAERGFDAEWTVLPASAFGAYHERARLFIVAYRNCPTGDQRYLLEACRTWTAHSELRRVSSMAVCQGVRDGSRAQLGGEPQVARLVSRLPGGLDRPRRKALGNSVYPAVAEYVGRKIIKFIGE